MAIDLHLDRDSRLSHPFLISACIVSVVLVTFVPVTQLLLRRWIDDAASIWDIGSSFFYLRQRQQLHLSVAGICLLRWLIRFPSNRRFARSIHLGARVLDALRIPLAGMQVYLVALVDAAVFISSPWTLLYQSFPLETFLYYVWFNIYIYIMFSSKKKEKEALV